MKSLRTYITIFTIHAVHGNDDMYTNNILGVSKHGTKCFVANLSCFYRKTSEYFYGDLKYYTICSKTVYLYNI